MLVRLSSSADAGLVIQPPGAVCRLLVPAGQNILAGLAWPWPHFSTLSVIDPSLQKYPSVHTPSQVI
jgi:hypothetical protein